MAARRERHSFPKPMRLAGRMVEPHNLPSILQETLPIGFAAFHGAMIQCPAQFPQWSWKKWRSVIGVERSSSGHADEFPCTTGSCRAGTSFEARRRDQFTIWFHETGEGIKVFNQ